jgi:exonuclease III
VPASCESRCIAQQLDLASFPIFTSKITPNEEFIQLNATVNRTTSTSLTINTNSSNKHFTNPDEIIKHLIRKQTIKESKQATKSLITQEKLLKIISHNVHGLESNHPYANQLALESNILVVQETKMTSQLALENNIHVPYKKIFCKPAKKTRGAPSGGMAFIVDKDLKCSVKFHSNRIGVLKLNKLTIINVYLMYHTGSKVDQAKFEEQIALIEEIIAQNENKGAEVIVVGDFNTDINKETMNSSRLFEALAKLNHSLKDVEMYTKQPQAFTFESKCTKRKRSWIDHVMYNISNKFLLSALILV